MRDAVSILWLQSVLLVLRPCVALAREASLLSRGTSVGKVPMVAEADNSEFTAVLETFFVAQGDGSTEEYALEEESLAPTDTGAEKLATLLCRYKTEITAATLFKPLVGSRHIQHAERCALVSNSGVLLQHSYGDEIDAADLVIRFNDAEVGGDARTYVGSRDDVRVLNRMLGNSIPSGAFNFTTDASTTYLLIRHREDEAELQHWLKTAGPGADHAHQEQIMVGTGKVEEIATQILRSPPFDVATLLLPAGAKYGNPTTGFLGLMFAMTICDEVHAYGFASSHAARHSPFHYYGSLKEVTGRQQLIHAGDHPLESVEKQVFQKLDNTGDAAQTDKTVIPGFGSLEFCS